MKYDLSQLIATPSQEVYTTLQSTETWLSSQEAAQRLKIDGPNTIATHQKKSVIIEFLLHFNNPLIIILLVAALISGLMGEIPSMVIIMVISMMSVCLDFYQEHKAGQITESLQSKIQTLTTVMRWWVKSEIPFSEIVSGDIVVLEAGAVIPADAIILSADDFFVDQSALTGESFPVEKKPLIHDKVATSDNPYNYVFMGTMVTSWYATIVITNTGGNTQFGELAAKISENKPETEFELGLKKFGYLIMKVTLMLVIFVFITQLRHKQWFFNAFLFAIALAVGLTPELLPMIITLNLSRGAKLMAEKWVIVKRLASIENLWSMDVLCTDKTGTLTANKISLLICADYTGTENDLIWQYASINSHFLTSLKSPLDRAVVERYPDLTNYTKREEVPFDFIRRKVTIVVEHNSNGEKLMITKGATDEILKSCTQYLEDGEIKTITPDFVKKLHTQHDIYAADGMMVLALCYKKLDTLKEMYTPDDEVDMVFWWFLAFLDPPKESAKSAIEDILSYNTHLKIITWDNDLVARKVCKDLNFPLTGILLGSEMEAMNDDALAIAVEQHNVFARINPIQKHRIITQLKKNGHVVWYMGDGINDAPSLKAADVSISVANAVDIAKQSADIILMEQDLRVLQDGIIQGRKTFGNTMKYILMCLSSNFGNMISASVSSIFLPFFTMLPIQLLLNNLLYDISQTTLPTDNVDEEYIKTPKKMDVGFIRSFMIPFGLVSSLFDFITFAVLIWWFGAWTHNQWLFQTGRFVQSFLTQTLIVFINRTRRARRNSKPGKYVLMSILWMIGLVILLPFTPIAPFFHFVWLPPLYFAYLAICVVCYLIVTEWIKTWFYKRHINA